MASNIPNLGDMQRDLKEFFSQKYGANIAFAQPEADGADSGPSPTNHPIDIQFDLKPEELEAYLNDYVIRQDEAKEILATKICTHFNRLKLPEADEPVGSIKNNIILIGPTGVGKTYLIKLIAKKIGVPFVKGDATKFSETGYVGGDVEDLVRALVHEAGSSIQLAQYGIIYIDEIDKIAASGTVIGPDVSRTGVQRNLLKLMEETEVDLQAPHDLASQMESALQFQKTGKIERKKINTKHILFIVSGAFAGLEDIIKRRLNQQRIGFGANPSSAPPENGAWLKHVKAEDFIQYGFESEFVGRLPVIAVLHVLTADDLYRILTNPNSPVIMGKKRDFQAYGITIEFDDDALRLIADRAYEEKTGARGLVGVCEKILIRYEKKLPSTDITHFRVTRAVVESPALELERLLTDTAIVRFERQFSDDSGIRLSLDPDARVALIDAARASGKTPDAVGRELFKDYRHGLKLLQLDEIAIPKTAVDDPLSYLNRLIKEFYEKQTQVTV